MAVRLVEERHQTVDHLGTGVIALDGPELGGGDGEQTSHRT